MSLFKNLKIWVKLMLGFGLVVAIFGGFSAYQVVSLGTLGEMQHTGMHRAEDAVAVGAVDSRLEHFYGIVTQTMITRDADAGARALAAFKPQARKDIEAVSAMADTREEKRLAGTFGVEYGKYMARFENTVLPALRGGADAQRLGALQQDVARLRDSSMEALDGILGALNTEMIEADEAFDTLHASILDTSLIACAIGLLVAVISASLTSLGIVRPLRRAVAYAGDVARGDFDTELSIDRKDEIGVLADAMRSIPATLGRMKDECNRVVATVRSGRLGERGDVGGFEGGYAEIIGGANLLADTYTHYLDSVPSPVMAIDKQMNVLFLNKTGCDVAGVPHGTTGGQCSELFCTSDCDTGNCACARSMQTGQVEKSETDAHPQGLDLEIAYSATPITDGDGEIVGALEIVADQTDIVNAKRKMEDVAHRADEISLRVSAATDQLAAQVEQVSRGSETQQSRMAETATAMEQMNSTVMEVARNASSASGNSGEARERALHGAEVVGRAVDAIGQVHTAAGELQENMRALGVQAESIGQVMDVIGDIADQTNLLALNAAIEAARAGDAGRGFAVVADEVRKLAEKTMAATQDVEQKIRAIQDSAQTNIDSMDTASKTVEQATELANESGRALSEIVALVEDNATQVDGIATASEEQSAASEQITGAVDEVNRIVGETNEGMQESSKALQELAVMSSELKTVLGQLASTNGNGNGNGDGTAPGPDALRYIAGGPEAPADVRPAA